MALMSSRALLLCTAMVCVFASGAHAQDGNWLAELMGAKSRLDHDDGPASCSGAITSLFCNEDASGRAADLAYINSLTGLRVAGCGTPNTNANWTKTLALQSSETITRVETCRAGRKNTGTFASVTFVTSAGQSLTCGTKPRDGGYGYGDDDDDTADNIDSYKRGRYGRGLLHIEPEALLGKSHAQCFVHRPVEEGSPLASFKAACSANQERVTAVFGFCWNENYVPPPPPVGPEVPVTIELNAEDSTGGVLGCPTTPAAYSKLLADLNTVSTRLAEASGGVIARIAWRVTPSSDCTPGGGAALEAQSLRHLMQLDGNTTITITGIIVAAADATTAQVIAYLNSIPGGPPPNLCNVDLNSLSICDGTDFFSILLGSLPPAVRVGLRGLLAAAAATAPGSPAAAASQKASLMTGAAAAGARLGLYGYTDKKK